MRALSVKRASKAREPHPLLGAAAQLPSPSGAIGLMQVMPGTATEIAARRQLSGHSEDRLWEPAYNLDLGAWYLTAHLAAFAEHGDRAIELAAIAYHGGPQRALNYLQRKSEAELNEQTRQYRDLVVGMGRERELVESSTYATWSQR